MYKHTEKTHKYNHQKSIYILKNYDLLRSSACDAE